MTPDRPDPTLPPPSPSGFVLFPVVGLSACAPFPQPWLEALYQWAYEQGRAGARPSPAARDPLGVWN